MGNAAHGWHLAPGSLATGVYVHYLPFLTPVYVGARAALWCYTYVVLLTYLYVYI